MSRSKQRVLVVKSVKNYGGRGKCSFDIPLFIYNKENGEGNFLYLLMKETGLLQEKPLFSWVIRVCVKKKPTLESGWVAKLHCIGLVCIYIFLVIDRCVSLHSHLRIEVLSCRLRVIVIMLNWFIKEETPAMQLSLCLTSDVFSRPQSEHYDYQMSSGLIFHAFNAFKHHPTFLNCDVHQASISLCHVIRKDLLAEVETETTQPRAGASQGPFTSRTKRRELYHLASRLGYLSSLN